jgi:hypothetical protein
MRTFCNNGDERTDGLHNGRRSNSQIKCLGTKSAAVEKRKESLTFAVKSLKIVKELDPEPAQFKK